MFGTFGFMQTSTASNGLLNNLQAYYKLDSNATDEQGNQNGTASNITWDTSPKQAGTHSADFNGSSSYIDINGVMTGLVKQDMSVSAWVYLKSAPASREQIVRWGKAGTPTSPWGNSLSIEVRNISGTTRLGCWLYAVGTDTIYSTETLSTSTWYHTGLSYEASTDTIKLYLDGSLVATQASAGVNTTDNHGEFQIGRSTDAANNRFHIDANIDEVGIWTSVLSADDFSTLASGVYYDDFTS